MVDELGPEFAPNAPSQSARARAAGCKDQHELRGYIEIFGNNPHATIRYVRDRAIPWQGAGPELNLCCPVTGAPFTFSPIYKHPSHHC